MNPSSAITSSDDEKTRRKQQKKQKRKEAQNNWFETTVNGGALVLTFLKEAADKVPAPYLKEAVGCTLAIIRLVQNVKDNKADFQLIAIDAATLVSHIYRSYEKSEDQANWPGKQLRDDLEGLVGTLLDIQLFTEARADNRMFQRIFNKDGDNRKIKEYRIKLNHAMASFQVVAQLQTYELLRLLKEKVESDLYQVKTTQVIVQKDREEQELLLARLEAEKQIKERLEAEERRRKEEEIRRKEKAALDVARLESELREAEMQKRLRDLELQKLRLKVDGLKQEEELVKRRRKAEEEREKLLLAEIAAKERREKEDADRRKRRDAESDDSSDEDELSDDDYSSEDTEDEIIQAAAQEKARKSARKAKAKANKTTEAYLSEALANAGIHHHPTPYGPPPGYYGPYNGSYAPSPYPGSSPFGTPMFAPALPPSPYLAPMGLAVGKGSNTTINSGNVVSSTISNVGNNYSRTTKPKKSSKRT